MNAIMRSMPKVHLVWVGFPRHTHTNTKLLASLDQHGYSRQEIGHPSSDCCPTYVAEVTKACGDPKHSDN